MIKDEEGFLSEFAAYYKMHGFSHVTIFDDNSTDRSMEELKPWVDSGFVSIKTDLTVPDLRGTVMRTAFNKAMSIKAVLETRCMKEAITWGYDYYLSVDLDEYILPAESDITFVDMLQKWQERSKRRSFCFVKFNFASTPHIAEPVHLLTIEAYQTRMGVPGKMNHYTSVAKKCMYKLKDPSYLPETPRFVAECCHFHGCRGDDLTKASNLCRLGWKNHSALVYGQDKGGRFTHLGKIFHYSRSLEKFALKAGSWHTATGEGDGGYSLSYFLHRSVGYTSDITALNYACQTREVLREVTGESRFLRFGDQWYRNIEFGKNVSDPTKRGRMGRPRDEPVKDGNPFLFDGTIPPLVKARKGMANLVNLY